MKSQAERGIIGLRTRMAWRSARPRAVSEGRAGCSVSAEFLPPYRRVIAMSGDGLSMNAISRTLNDESVSTARGGNWHASTVRAVLTSETAKAL